MLSYIPRLVLNESPKGMTKSPLVIGALMRIAAWAGISIVAMAVPLVAHHSYAGTYAQRI